MKKVFIILGLKITAIAAILLLIALIDNGALRLALVPIISAIVLITYIDAYVFGTNYVSRFFARIYEWITKPSSHKTALRNKESILRRRKYKAMRTRLLEARLHLIENTWFLGKIMYPQHFIIKNEMVHELNLRRKMRNRITKRHVRVLPINPEPIERFFKSNG